MDVICGFPRETRLLLLGSNVIPLRPILLVGFKVYLHLDFKDLCYDVLCPTPPPPTRVGVVNFVS